MSPCSIRPGRSRTCNQSLHVPSQRATFDCAFPFDARRSAGFVQSPRGARRDPDVALSGAARRRAHVRPPHPRPPRSLESHHRRPLVARDAFARRPGDARAAGRQVCVDRHRDGVGSRPIVGGGARGRHRGHYRSPVGVRPGKPARRPFAPPVPRPARRSGSARSTTSRSRPPSSSASRPSKRGARGNRWCAATARPHPATTISYCRRPKTCWPRSPTGNGGGSVSRIAGRRRCVGSRATRRAWRAAVVAGDAVVERRLLGVRGVGPWTAAHVLHFVSADADAVPVGDWHLPGHVGNALAGEPRADDARMLELLEPFRPHRGRVWRLLLRGVRSPPRRAPRARIHDLMRAEANRGRR